MDQTGNGGPAGSGPGKRDVLGFVDPAKGARHYVRRYVSETKYHDWFHRNYPGYAIYEGIGISKDEFERLVDELTGTAASSTADTAAAADDHGHGRDDGGAGGGDKGGGDGGEDGLTRLKRLASLVGRGAREGRTQDGGTAGAESRGADASAASPQTVQVPRGEDLARTVFESYPDDGYDGRTFEEFVDERALTSRDLFGKKEMRIKILEVSDEIQDSKIRWKFGDRVKVNKILVTIKHLDTMQVEEGEFDIEAIERELAQKRHWSSTNRWVPSSDIKNGYVVNSKHTALISDAVALDYIVF